MRIVLFTGKGGVGKTTLAAATAVRASRDGLRVLLTSTDPAHSLADTLDLALGDAPTPVGDRLWAQQIDAQARLERHWRDVRDYLVRLLAWGGMSTVEAEELALLPGLDELFSLVDLRHQVASGSFDLAVVDCAPTAETLRLLSLPDALDFYVRRLVPLERRVARVVRPLISRVSAVPVPEDPVFAAVETIHDDLGAVHAMLQDATMTSVRLVVNPERVVIAETLRTATWLSLFGYANDAVIVNRLLPDEVTDPYLARWRQRHAEHLEVVRASFAPTPVLTAPLLDDEVVGIAALAQLADIVYGDRDAAAVLHRGRPMDLTRVGDGYVLRIALPFTARDDVDLQRNGDSLHLKVAGVRRTIALPAAVRRHEVAGARHADDVLEVRFAAAVAAATP